VSCVKQNIVTGFRVLETGKWKEYCWEYFKLFRGVRQKIAFSNWGKSKSL